MLIYFAKTINYIIKNSLLREVFHFCTFIWHTKEFHYFDNGIIYSWFIGSVGTVRRTIANFEIFYFVTKIIMKYFWDKLTVNWNKEKKKLYVKLDILYMLEISFLIVNIKNSNFMPVIWQIERFINLIQ